MMKKKLNKIGEVKIEKILEDDRYLIHIIRKNWKKIAGEMIAEYSFPSFFGKGKLTIIVGNNLILNEMRMYQETLLDNINEALYDNRVKDLYLKTGNLYDKKEELYRDFDDEAFDPSEVKITEEEKIEISEDEDVTVDKNKRYNLNCRKLSDYIHGSYPKWKANTVYNDVNSINQINIKRKDIRRYDC